MSVTANQAANRYEIMVDGALAGYAEYRLDPAGAGTITFTRTVVEDAFDGQGVGSRLARGALDDARGRGLRVVAQCPFIRGWIDRHPDYADLLAESP
ncbi:MAG TPA: GNAT family N-acetyltransferase [Acidimicrobiales bacterium]|nr:GNAT family N-acetyltransferase [Acidimicrobiales bacterium]